MENRNTLPAWMTLAEAELGTKEIPGARHNPRVVDYFHRAGWKSITDDETAWCAAFVSAILRDAGVLSPMTVRARDFLKYGSPLDRPVYGCIVVTSRGNIPHQGHVNFFLGLSKDGQHFLGLGGNQSNSVSEAWFPVSSILPGGLRWPTLVPAYEPTPSPSRPMPPPIPVHEYGHDTPEAAADRLRRQGSRIVTGADRTEAGAKGMATLGITSVVTSVVTAFTEFYNMLSPLVPVIGLTMLGTLALVFAAYTIREQQRIRAARVEDHINGLHMGRRDAQRT
jgi:uncharacterized protein (TIGR02594 family)